LAGGDSDREITPNTMRRFQNSARGEISSFRSRSDFA